MTLGFPRSSSIGSCHEYVRLGLDALRGSWRSGLRSPLAAMTYICIWQDLYDKLRWTYDGPSMHDRLGNDNPHTYNQPLGCFVDTRWPSVFPEVTSSLGLSWNSLRHYVSSHSFFVQVLRLFEARVRRKLWTYRAYRIYAYVI